MSILDDQQLENQAFKIYCHLDKPMTKEKLDAAEKEGMIGKTALKNGSHYFGECRNARIAVWSAEIGLFVHWRHKFGYFLEDIPHPADDEGFDIFVPIKEVSLSEIGENDGKVRRAVSAEDLAAFVKKHLEWKAACAARAKADGK